MYRDQEIMDRLQKAKDALIAEQTRGYVIRWKNDFKRLERFSDPSYVRSLGNGWRPMSEEDVAMVTSTAIENCQSFQDTHRKVNGYELSCMLEDVEDKYAEKLMHLANMYGGNVDDASSAIMFLAKNRMLDEAIDELDEILQALVRMASA